MLSLRDSPLHERFTAVDAASRTALTPLGRPMRARDQRVVSSTTLVGEIMIEAHALHGMGLVSRDPDSCIDLVSSSTTDGTVTIFTVQAFSDRRFFLLRPLLVFPTVLRS